MTDTMQSMPISGMSNFKFSAVRPEELGATEYTLVSIVVDISSSVWDFKTELKAAVQAIIETSRKSPRSDNLLIRLTTFNNSVSEIIGFKALQSIATNDIEEFHPDGMTALYDASLDAVSATEQYAGILYDQDFDVNAAVYIISDGVENRSVSATSKKIAEKVKDIRVNERLESMITYLIGVNTSYPEVKHKLQVFADEAEIDQYIDIGEASKENLVKLAGYVSKSISSQSQSLGSGAASQSLTF